MQLALEEQKEINELVADTEARSEAQVLVVVAEKRMHTRRYHEKHSPSGWRSAR